HAWRIVYWYLLQEPDGDKRSDLFVSAMRDSKGLTIAAALIKIDEDRRAKTDEEQKLLTDEGLSKARSLWIEKIRSKALDEPERLLNAQDLGRLLFRWRAWDSAEYVGRWIGAMCRIDGGLVKILMALSSRVRSQTIGDAVARIRREVDLSAIE